MEIIARTLAGLRVGSPGTFGGLTVFPLTGSPDGDRAGYLTLDQALEAGTLRVTEVDQGGSVPELAVVNDGQDPVLLLDGEELVGAKQNRVLNLSVLVPGGKSIVIPVSCVEAGRWAWHGRDFQAAQHLMYAGARLEKMAQVSRSLAASGAARSDQGAVWASIAAKARRFGSHSPSGAMRDIYRDSARRLDDYVAAFSAADNQSGAIFAIAGKLTGVEVFDHPATLGAMLPKVVRSYALDALEHADRAHEMPAVDAARGFLDEIASARCEARDGVGLGQDVRLAGDRLAGGALVHDGRLVHLSAFRIDGAGGAAARRQARMTRASRRRPRSA